MGSFGDDQTQSCSSRYMTDHLFIGLMQQTRIDGLNLEYCVTRSIPRQEHLLAR